MAMLWITAPESAREETQGEIVNKLDSEVYEPEMDDDDDEEEETMEETFEETVEEKVEMVHEEIKEDKLYI